MWISNKNAGLESIRCRWRIHGFKGIPGAIDLANHCLAYRCIHTAASDSSTMHNHRTDGGHRLAPSPGTDDHGKHEMVSEFDNRTHIRVQVDTHSKEIPRSFGSTPSLNKDVHNAALCCYPSYSYQELSSTANNPQRYRPA
jgi:hypothetical protein